jgi:hypothetical protein
MSKCSVFKSRCLIFEHVDNQFIIVISARLYFHITLSGMDGTRTRDPMRDRHVF